MLSSNGFDVAAAAITVVPTPMRWLRYALGEDGEFAPRGADTADAGQLATITRCNLYGDPVDVTYGDTTRMRAIAGGLLGYAAERDTTISEPGRTTLLAPTVRTTTGSSWNLARGLVLRYTAPFGIKLTSDADEWTLTPELALQWARALLTAAAELDHAHAVAAQAVLAQRAGQTPTENIRGWLNSLVRDRRVEQDWFVDALRDVLADEESIIRGETTVTAFDLAHPELPTSLTELLLSAIDNLTHLDAAEVIAQLAHRYALPHFVWTATSNHVVDELDDQPLSEQEWRRVGRSTEMTHFVPMLLNEQNNNGAALDIRKALYQAGALCRGCGIRITGPMADTLGRCVDCRPADLADVLDTGCPGAEDLQGDYLHSVGSNGACRECDLPLPANYHLAMQAAEAEEQRAEDEWYAEQREQERRDRTAAAESMTAADAHEIVARAADISRHLSSCNLDVSQCGTCSAEEHDTSTFWDLDVPAARERLSGVDSAAPAADETASFAGERGASGL